MLTHLFKTYMPPGLYAEIDTRNTGSIRLVERLGLGRVGLTESADHFKGVTSDEYTYRITGGDWTRIHGQQTTDG